MNGSFSKQLNSFFEKAFTLDFTAYVLSAILFFDNFLIIAYKSSILNLKEEDYVSPSNWIFFVFAYLLICSVLIPFIKFMIDWGICLLHLRFKNRSVDRHCDTVLDFQLRQLAADKNSSVMYNIYKEHQEEKTKTEKRKQVYFSLLVFLIVNLLYQGSSISSRLCNDKSFAGKAGLFFIVFFIVFLIITSLNYNDNEDRIRLELEEKPSAFKA